MFNKLLSQNVENSRHSSGLALLLGRYDEDSQILQDWAYQEFKISMMVVAYCQSAQNWLTETPVNYKFICVDLDHFQSMNEAVEVCLWLRKEKRGTKIILLSHDVVTDDFGTERNIIADATLRKPVTLNRFTDTMGILFGRELNTIDNTKDYAKVLKEMYPDADSEIMRHTRET
ncbi:hypothetical protein [Roseinatronobacter sp.]|uniref:hypothetical protein n=1 Tax=Roseinatronobacter sp. TaxID=1945755 RepID=UPI0025F2E344|nr:hypothetical protein [Roseibaca sp.]